MTIREGLKTVPKKYIRVLKGFLLGATLVAALGIVTVSLGEYPLEARYLTILAATLACQGVWGAVLCDCMHRRLKL